MASVAASLSQALAVRDDAALDTCFAGECKQRKEPGLCGMVPCCFSRPQPPCCCPLDCAVHEDAVIASSVAQLSAAHAGALLEALVERLQLQPQQAARLVPWLRSLLLTHGAALAAAPAGQVRAAAGWGREGGREGGCQPAAAVLFATCFLKQPPPPPPLTPHDCALLVLLLQAALRLAHQLLQERTASFGGLLSLSGRLQVLQPAGDGGSEAGGAPAARGGATAKVRGEPCFLRRLLGKTAVEGACGEVQRGGQRVAGWGPRACPPRRPTPVAALPPPSPHFTLQVIFAA